MTGNEKAPLAGKGSNNETLVKDNQLTADNQAPAFLDLVKPFDREDKAVNIGLQEAGMFFAKEKPLNPILAGIKEGEKTVKDYYSAAIQYLIPQGVEVPKPEVTFEIDGIPLFTRKSVSLLIAKAKAGKTTVAAWIVAQILKKGNVKVLWIDTEQGLYYGSRTQHWILAIAQMAMCENLSYFDLKIFPPHERVEMVNSLIERGAYGMVVIDGIRDLVTDINSPEQATMVATDLMRWAEEYNVHLLTILHQNKSDSNARGHLGTELVNKAETVIKVSNETGDVVAEPEYSRGEPFQPFALSRGEYGIPYRVDGWVKPTTSNKKRLSQPNEVSTAQHQRILMDVFKGGFKPKLGELKTRLSNCYSAHFECEFGGRRIDALLDFLLNDLQLIGKDGKDRSPNTFYYLTTDNITGDVPSDDVTSS